MTSEPASADAASTRCGFVAILGAPNVGKSTLLNHLVGSKVSIVSPKVQTTRSRILGIRIAGVSQVIFVDTPGIFAPRRRLDRAMIRAAWQGAEDADFVLLLIDAERGVDRNSRSIIDGLKQANRHAVLVINKVDLIKKARLLELAETLDRKGIFTDIFMISALTGDGVGDLLTAIGDRLPEGPWLYPEDQISTIPMRMLAAEITREKLFLQLRQELPYAVAVETEKWEEFTDGSVRIGQVVYVQRDTQKSIVLGKGGRRIKALGEAARAELQDILGQRVHLVIFVKVREHWMDDPERYRDLGLDYEV